MIVKCDYCASVQAKLQVFVANAAICYSRVILSFHDFCATLKWLYILDGIPRAGMLLSHMRPTEFEHQILA